MKVSQVLVLLVLCTTVAAQELPPVVFQTEDAGRVEIPPKAVEQVMRGLSRRQAAALVKYANKSECLRDEETLMREIDQVRTFLIEATEAERNALNTAIAAAAASLKQAVLERRELASKAAEELAKVQPPPTTTSAPSVRPTTPPSR